MPSGEIEFMRAVLDENAIGTDGELGKLAEPVIKTLICTVPRRSKHTRETPANIVSGLTWQ